MLNTESRQIALTPNGPSGVYFAIQDQGACVSLIQVKVYYVACPNVTKNFAAFGETPTAAERYAVVEQDGHCVDHATKKSDLKYLCRSDGVWINSHKGECVCNPGYAGNVEATECLGEIRSQVSIIPIAVIDPHPPSFFPPSLSLFRCASTTD